jgi:serine/threonine protein kinase
VALKVPRGGDLSSGEDQDRFFRKARSAAQLRHPNVVPLYEVGRAKGMPYLVSGYVQGVTLADLLPARRPPAREAAQLVETSLRPSTLYASPRACSVSRS